MLRFFALLLALATVVAAQVPLTKCAQCDAWRVPQKPFKLFGNSYYVGTHGLSSVLIVSDAGHILIDGALAESAAQIAANIKALGYRIEDVKLILNSHVHYDHAAGIAGLQRLSGARVAALPWSAAVLKSGGSAKDDPQYGQLIPIDPVANVETIQDGQTLKVGDLAITAHSTPGHTPGGTSWTWTSCESRRCLNLVYGDSLTTAASPNYKFTRDYPNAAQAFAKSFEFLRTTPCDILVTTHPDISDLWTRLKARESAPSPDPIIDPGACKRVAGNAEAAFKERVASETK